jgi:hypothetical protein
MLPRTLSVNSTPLRAVDPRGLVRWEGTSFQFSIGLGDFAYGYEGYNLVSECKCNKKYVIQVRADMGSVGVGFPVSFGGQTGVSFDDPLECPDPNVFNGLYKKEGGTWGFIGYNRITMGRAVSSGFGFLIGYEFGVNYNIGKSRAFVLAKIECCEGR